MAARRRRNTETYEDYRSSLKREAAVEKIRLKGRWVWRSFIPHQNEEGEWVMLKMPPYRKPVPRNQE